MKFSCDRTNLVEALLNVQRAVSPKSTIPALEGIYIKAHDEAIELCGYNTDLAIKTNIPAQVSSKGEIVIGARLLVDIVRKLPQENLTLEVLKNLSVYIESGLSRFTLSGMDASNFPEIPQIDSSISIDIDGKTAKDMIRQTVFAVAETDDKPILKGTLFDIKNKILTLVSVDGYRMAIKKETINQDLQRKFVVPGKTLEDLIKLITNEQEENLKISAGTNHILFDTGKYSIISRLLEGEFLDYETTIPANSMTRAFVNTRIMAQSIDRVSLLITDRLRSPLKCEISKNQARVSCTTSIGKAVDEFAVDCEGEDVEIGFNNRYMLDALNNSGTDEVKIEFNGPLSPIKITPCQDEGFLFLVLPVRLKA